MITTSVRRGCGEICVLFIALALSGCTGLKQFPETSVTYTADLAAKDPDYASALQAISQANADPVAIRNHLIDERLRVIDLNFGEFQRTLARNNVTTDFSVAVAQLVLGAWGAAAPEATSQALSATSAVLAGSQQAYSKAALYQQTMSALLAQMIAARSSVLVKIMTGRNKSISEYPLAAAMQDLETYLFAGSLPGAVVATAADAKVKSDEADAKLDKLRTNSFTESDGKARILAYIAPSGDLKKPDPKKLKAVEDWIDKSPVKGLPIANFVTNKDLEDMRTKMIRELSIPEKPR